MVITRSVKIKKDTFLLAPSSKDSTVITIKGNNIIIDFNGAVLKSTANPHRPDLFTGTGIKIIGGSNVKIQNVVVRGYKVGLMATNCDSLHLTDTDFSYNYRQQLTNIPDKEKEENKEIGYHHNEKDQWLKDGAAVYLKNCHHAQVKNLTVTGGQNGLLLSQCTNGLFYNNTIQYNSGLGIGLYHSSKNWVMHNQLDWNIGGHNQNKYSAKQNAAGLLVYENSSDNVFAYNSVTHSTNGLLLWSGPSALTPDQGDCNNNLIYGNDFSHAANHGITINLSSNNIVNNRIEDCDYGIWGKYTPHTLILGNTLKKNNTAITIERGQANIIRNNLFDENQISIHLSTQSTQADRSVFTQKQNSESKNYEISENFFNDTLPLQTQNTKDLKITKNTFQNFADLWAFDSKPLLELFNQNKIYPSGKIDPTIKTQLGKQLQPTATPLPIPTIQANNSAEYAPALLTDGQDATLPEGQLRGRSYVLINQWGPYDFQYPTIRLRKVNQDQYTFAIFGPSGNWKITGGQGVSHISKKRGRVPNTVTATRAEGATEIAIELEFIGEEATTVFGERIKRGKGIPFSWKGL